MNRRQYLAGAGTASIAGFALVAGCSGLDGSSENSGDSGNENGGGGGSSGGSGSNDSGGNDGSNSVPTEDAGSVLPTANDEAIDTGQAPPDETGTPFENTNTVPEVEGLETGAAPNATDERS